MKFTYDDWEQPKDPRDAYERIVRPADRWPRQEDEVRYSRRGIPMRDCEYADFVTRGGKIDLGEKRFEWQRRSDRQHEKNQRRHPLTETVLDCLARWSSSEYLDRHRATVRSILEKSRNQRRRKLSGISTKLRGHQQALRLIHAIAFEGLTAAEYCQQHELDPADASRMLDHLYKKEFGLADAIGAISACAAMTSWQNRQENRRRRYKEGRGKKATLVLGADYSNVADRGEWLADTSAGSRRSYTTGAAASISDAGAIPKYMRNDPIRPETGCAPSRPPHRMHRASTWRREKLLIGFWDAFVSPVRAVRLLEPRFDRYRETKRTLKYKGSRQKKSKIVARILDGTTSPLRADYLVEARRDYLLWVKPDLPEPCLPLLPPHGIFHRRFRPVTPIHIILKTFDLPGWAALDVRTRDLPVGRHENELHPGGLSRIFRGLPVADCNGKAPPSLKQSWSAIEDRLAEAKWFDGPMCRPYRTTKLCGPWRFRVRFHQPTNATRIKPFTKLGAICWLGPLRRATAKDWAEWKRNKPKDYADFLPAK